MRQHPRSADGEGKGGGVSMAQAWGAFVGGDASHISEFRLQRESSGGPSPDHCNGGRAPHDAFNVKSCDTQCPVSESGPLRAVHVSRHKWPGG